MNGGGHIIAWRLCTNNVTQKTRDAIAKLNLDPNDDDFGDQVNSKDADVLSMATEPDEDKFMERMHPNGCGSHGGEHYANNPIGDAQYYPKTAPTGPDAISKVTDCEGKLKAYATAQASGKPVDAQTTNDAAQAIRWMAHETGDLFGQPLHDINHFSAEFPKGDEGGNSIKLPGFFPSTVKYQELHNLCDMLGVTGQQVNGKVVPFAGEETGPITPALLKQVDAKVATIEKEYPSSHFTIQQVTTTDLHQIAAENSKVAEQIYTYNDKTGAEVQNGQQISPSDPWLGKVTGLMHESAALGGLRMAYLLDTIFDPANAMKQAEASVKGEAAPANLDLSQTSLTSPSEQPISPPSNPTSGSSPRPTHRPTHQPAPSGGTTHRPTHRATATA
ncbi:MAG TPA: S1/P1 nuclease [Candidatus Xenobia bacterium]